MALLYDWLDASGTVFFKAKLTLANTFTNPGTDHEYLYSTSVPSGNQGSISEGSVSYTFNAGQADEVNGAIISIVRRRNRRGGTVWFRSSTDLSEFFNDDTDTMRMTMVTETLASTIRVIQMEPAASAAASWGIQWSNNGHPTFDASDWANFNALGDGDELLLMMHEGDATYEEPQITLDDFDQSNKTMLLGPALIDSTAGEHSGTGWNRTMYQTGAFSGGALGTRVSDEDSMTFNDGSNDGIVTRIAFREHVDAENDEFEINRVGSGSFDTLVMGNAGARLYIQTLDEAVDWPLSPNDRQLDQSLTWNMHQGSGTIAGNQQISNAQYQDLLAIQENGKRFVFALAIPTAPTVKEYVGSVGIVKEYVGDVEIVKQYVGSVEVWS